jgi:osmotically-inducible protein OsmY
MEFGSQIPDKTLLKNVSQKLARRAAGANRVTATVRSGDVTLTGTISYEHERRPLLRICSGIQGVRRVIDQLQIAQRKTGQE